MVLNYLVKGRNGTSITESPFFLRFIRGRWSSKAFSTSSSSILSLELGTFAEAPTRELTALEPVVLVTITKLPENQICNHFVSTLFYVINKSGLPLLLVSSAPAIARRRPSILVTVTLSSRLTSSRMTRERPQERWMVDDREVGSAGGV